MSVQQLSSPPLIDRTLDCFVRCKGRLRPVALFTAMVLFCAGLFFSLRATPSFFSQITFAPLGVSLFFLLPAGMVISAIDFQLLARLSKVRIGIWRAFEITIYTRAANMLPIPGSMAVRLAVLKERGATLRRSGSLVFLFTIIWGGIGLCFSAIWLAAYAPMIVTAAFAGAGIAILSAAAFAVWRARLARRLVGAAAFLRFLFVVLDAFLLLMAMKAVGVDATYHQAAAMVAASFLASIVPAGIGVRETIIAVLSPLAGIDPAMGFLAATVMRVTGMTFLTLCTCAAALAAHNPSGASDSPENDSSSIG